MSSTTRTFDKRTVYHSVLRGAGPLVVQFTHGLQESRYANRGRYITFKVRGDDTSYTYEPENKEIESALERLLQAHPDRTAWFTLVAEGDRDGASLSTALVNARGGGQMPPAAPAGDPGPVPPPPPPDEDRGAPDTSIAGDLWRALDVGREIVEQFRRKYGREPTDPELRLTASLFIEMQRAPKRLLTREA